jgi:hypothetical protein
VCLHQSAIGSRRARFEPKGENLAARALNGEWERGRVVNGIAGQLLGDLRAHIGEEPSLLPDVNSGLSVRRVSED